MIGLFQQETPTSRSAGVKAAQLIEAALLLSGMICVGWFGYNWIASEADQLWSNYSLDERLTGHAPSAKGFFNHIIKGGADQIAAPPSESADAGSRAEPRKEEPQKEEAPDWPANIPRGEDIGRIEIPRLRISSIIRQGVDDKTLSRAVGHVPYTALPGQEGNVGLAAHRDSYFRELRDVRAGDLIRLVTPKGTFEYHVESLRIVHPTNVEVLDPTPNPSLTLVTCYPFNYVGHAPKRFIVRARQNKIPVPGTRRS